jgi:L-fucose isomerase-like protein
MSEMTQVAAGMAHVDRGMGVGPKPTLGVIFVAKKNQYQGEIRHMAEYYRQRLGQDPTLRLMAEEEILFGERDVVARAQRMEAEGADLIVLVVGTWIFSSIIVAAVNDLKTPFVLYGLSDRVANGNLGASLQIRYVLQEMGKRFLYLSGPVKDEGNIQTMLRYLKAAWIKRYLCNRKIATIGGKCMMMYQTQVNEFNWKSVFGVDFPQYDTVQVFHEMEQVGDEEAHRVEQEFLSRVSQVHWEWEHDREQKIYRDAIFSQAKMYLAFRRLQELYGIDVFANKCMPEMSHEAYGYGYAGCLATCMLNEAGITCACEADVPAGLSMYILRLLSGGPVFFADIARLSKERREVAFFNCGTAPISLADPAKGVHLYPIPSNISDEAVPDAYFISHMKGACIWFELEVDRPVTIMRIGGNGDTLRFHVATATTAQREVTSKDDPGSRWPGFALRFQGDLDAFLNNSTGHHYSLVYGDYGQELRYLAEILGIKFVYSE